jgi:hypothetical protein
MYIRRQNIVACIYAMKNSRPNKINNGKNHFISDIVSIVWKYQSIFIKVLFVVIKSI